MTETQVSSTHPPLPPTTEEDRFGWLRLLRSRRVGVSTFHRLLAEHGTAQNALAALPEVARAAGVKDYEVCPPGVIEAELKAAKAAKARLLCLGSTDYPTDLQDISDAPPMLWAIGNTNLLLRQKVAMVGARNASSLGTRMARSLAKGLGDAGITVVSGLARGIDTAAHTASLPTGTIAVMAGGVDVIYPAENSTLAGEIRETGLILSERPMGLNPHSRDFPRRNRIISGLSQAVVVVEAAAKSGSLITARDALDQGREVMAVPGHPFDARASGCNMLIRDGAVLVRGPDDVLAGMPANIDVSEPVAPPAHPTLDHLDIPQPPERRSLRETTQLHQQILNQLGPSPVPEDQLIRDLSAQPSDIGPALVDLELQGQIRRQPGGLLARVV